MFCPKCGTQLPNSAKFCASCGTPTETSSTKEDRQPLLISQRGSLKQPKRLFLLVAIIVIVVVFLSSLINLFSSKFEAEKVALQYIDEKYCSTFGAEVDSISKNGKNHYIIGYDISQDHDLWQSKGMIKLSVYKKNDEWMVDVIEENIDYHFEKNDNWYYITGSGNREFLVKMLSLTDKEVTLECYGYDMGSYGGPDDYEHELISCDLEYDGSNRCFRFQFMGDWCINGSYIGYNRFEVGTNYEYYQSSSKKVNILKPVRPDDYWWYDIAKNQNIE